MPNRHGVEYATDVGRRYGAYISSSAWSRKRAAYWKKYGRFCKVPDCGTTVDLHVHHHTYKRLGEELLTDLVGLCREHHMRVHDVYEESSFGRTLTEVTEAVTGLSLRSATRAKRARKSAPKKQSIKTKRQIAEGRAERQLAAASRAGNFGSKPGQFDSVVSARYKPIPLRTVRTNPKPMLPRGEGKRRARAAVIQGRVEMARRHEQAQEVARRIAASKD